MVDQARSFEYLLSTLVPGNPEPPAQTALLAQSARDLITTIILKGLAPDGYQFNIKPQVVSASGVDPNRGLVAGVAATVRFPGIDGSKVPPGVNGSDTNHYIYISDGGLSEAVLITGGTAIGGSTGTLIFTPANSHSGNTWSLISASGGTQEAMIAQPTALIDLQAKGGGGYTFYAPVTVPSTCPGVIGSHYLCSLVYLQYTNASVFKMVSAGQAAGFRNFSIIPLAGNMTAGSMIEASVGVYLTVEGMYLGSPGGGRCGYYGVSVTSVGGGQVTIKDCWFLTEYRPLDLNGVSVIINDVVCNGERTYLTYIAGSCAMRLANCSGGLVNGFFHSGGVYDAALLFDVSTGTQCNEIAWSNVYLDNWRNNGIFVTGSGSASHHQFSSLRVYDLNAVWGTGDTNTKCVNFAGTVQNWQFAAFNIAFAYGVGVYPTKMSSVTFAGGSIYPTLNAGTPGDAVNIDAAGTVADLTFSGVTIGTGFETVKKATHGIINNLATLDGLTVVGCTVEATLQANKIVLLGSETRVEIDSINGISNVAKTVAAATALAFPVMCQNDILTITGTGAPTSVSGLREGQEGTLVFTNGSPGIWTAGGTIGNTCTPIQNVPVPFMFTGGKIYLTVYVS